MINRRNYVRYIVEGKVSIKTKGDTSKTMVGQLLDLSSAGWTAFFKESIDVNAIIQFDLTPNFLEKHLKGKGRIIYVTQQKISGSKGFRIGVEFIEADKEIISGLLNEKQRLIRQEQVKVIEAERKKQQSKALNIGPF